ncbi:MAG TPA: ABC transporter ATP-binding protein [Thermodesulfobacteriota bacterium]|nr:ABC transporter ATP-binding protein [Thermodesulfobacteriota bacterium]
MALLQVQELTKQFGGLTACNGVSVDIEAGEIVGLIGPNGAGKTTLFNCIAGYYQINGGKVIFDGKEISNLPPNEICRLGIARTFQVVRIFKDMTVMDNLMVGGFVRTLNTRRVRQDALEVLNFTGLAAKKDMLGGALTIADKKRLEIARALMTGPRLLMLDEAMAGLTQTETQQALEIIHKLHKQKITMFLVEHVMEVIMPISSRVLVLEYGKKIAEDVPEKIIYNDDVIKAYLGEKYHAMRQGKEGK